MLDLTLEFMLYLTLDFMLILILEFFLNNKKLINLYIDFPKEL